MPPSPRLSDVLQQYLDLRKDNQAINTYEQDRTYLLRLLAHVGNIQMRHLEARHLQAWLQAPPPLGVGGLAPGTFNNALQRLRGFDGYCREQGHYSRSLISRTVKAKSDPPKKRIRYSAKELLAIIDAAEHPRDRMVVALLANTALRAGEVTSIRWGDVDLDQGSIDVTIHKSKKVDRRPITADLDRELRRWKAYVTSECGMPLADWYLVPAKSSFRWENTPEGQVRNNLGRLRPTVRLSTPHRYVQLALSRLGLPTDKEGGHTIRRSVALIYFEQLVGQGYDDALLTVSALLNHSNVTVTQRYLGMDRHVEKRDTSLRGVAFLTDGAESATVTALPIAAGGNE
jgi:integrase